MRARFDNPNKSDYSSSLSYRTNTSMNISEQERHSRRVQYEGTRTTGSPATMLLVRTWHSWVWRLIGGVRVRIIGCGRHPRQRLVGADWWDARPPPNMAHDFENRVAGVLLEVLSVARKLRGWGMWKSEARRLSSSSDVRWWWTILILSDGMCPR